jgi:hypothetical protein
MDHYYNEKENGYHQQQRKEKSDLRLLGFIRTSITMYLFVNNTLENNFQTIMKKKMDIINKEKEKRRTKTHQN